MKTDTSECQLASNNLAVYLQGVSVSSSTNVTSEYLTTATLPSSKINRRVWQFCSQGIITGPGTATIQLDYTQAHLKCPTYGITFEGPLNGTLTVHNQVFSANKYISYTLVSTYVLELTVTIPKRIQECYGTTTPQSYFFNVYINDSSCTQTAYISFLSTPSTQNWNLPASYYNAAATSLQDTFLYSTQLLDTYQLQIIIWAVNSSSDTYCFEFKDIADSEPYENQIQFINNTGFYPPCTYGLNSDIAAALAQQITLNAYVQNNTGSRVCFSIPANSGTDSCATINWNDSKFEFSDGEPQTC